MKISHQDTIIYFINYVIIFTLQYCINNYSFVSLIMFFEVENNNTYCQNKNWNNKAKIMNITDIAQTPSIIVHNIIIALQCRNNYTLLYFITQ